MEEHINKPKDFTCINVKYLGSLNAMYPQTGTLENIARLYQKGCALNQRDINAQMTVSRENVSLLCKDTEKIFRLHKILFCASYKKIPRVVAFNYQASTSPRRIECHAFLCSSNEDARGIVAALTMAFRVASKERNSDEIGLEQTTITRKVWNLDSAEEKEVKVLFALPRKIGEILDSLTNCIGTN
ncbi:uncharacterized protein [Montipora capricornis]|uniref:uncharacterized protein n=1 Tax=Montipora capricornis TaxID=246305 RepID=UPI0035F1EA4C